jgi:hypothetical protein
MLFVNAPLLKDVHGSEGPGAFLGTLVVDMPRPLFYMGTAPHNYHAFVLCNL